MKALVTGAGGQLGRCLLDSVPAGVEAVGLDRAALDITDGEAVTAAVEALQPDLIVNAAAYTAVDRAESDEDAATRINAEAVAHLARAAGKAGARFAHVSTDFVFDGRSGIPYRPQDPIAPLGAYGRSKAAGEAAAGDTALIVRTAWVYGPVGGNFVRTMLRLMAERDEVRVVADQIGTPTYAPALAQALWTLTLDGVQGIHHFTDSGAASWYDFAVAIQEEALALGLLARQVPVVPIASADFPTPAQRPHYSVLDKASTFSHLGTVAPHWRVNLRTMLGVIRDHG